MTSQSPLFVLSFSPHRSPDRTELLRSHGDGTKGTAPKRSIPSRRNNLSLRCLKAISKATPQGVGSE